MRPPGQCEISIILNDGVLLCSPNVPYVDVKLYHMENHLCFLSSHCIK